jgi:hypothetical protein
MLFLHLLLLAFGELETRNFSIGFCPSSAQNRDIVAGEISKPGTAALISAQNDV